MIVEQFPDRTIQVEGKEYLYFGGTAYLGLPTHQKFQEILVQSIKKWGSFYGSSRNSNIKLSIFEQAEDFFAKQIGSEASLTASSGTLAGKLVLDYLSKSNNIFYHYPKTHPAILGNNSSPLFIKGKLHSNLLNDVKENIVITADAVLALELEPTSFSFLEKISKQKNITLLVDESHSLGIAGKEGEGVFKAISNENLVRKIMVSSLGKALGLSGGIIASDKDFIEYMKRETLFVSSSCANPGYLEAYLQSQNLIKEQHLKLNENLNFLFEDLNVKPILKFNKSYPVVYSEKEDIYNYLFNKGIIISNFKYPTYKGLMSRIVITANHTKADLEKLKNVLNEIK
ncbi:aminotransferase class I/II-fold pyridoxal phosphate-dependent enzyme [Flaviramulus sp. BrNp1-15]|uniref:aminotransferase class I/II-fold pyridoxal phosphate-dependent enzyme n=1 Tax=Flaviramulus sp. BrNp1-15 TaxID=2916754 RepID=UPI001EE92B10|nr:aminotransferase class I/II-fold pyridoxal phosphate-dependent enzyme [Flaviramulus sp. BrNp1-15]ULC59641.1 aminotransferase class I/II-fold pyridoxal phosphate-dependent enzyme [Flaviramulus sp. BrNp1-15]